MIDCSTGLPGLDRVLKGVMPGDNVVWQVEEIEDYRDLVVPYAQSASRRGLHLVYFRFAAHPELLSATTGVEVRHPDPRSGFEHFVNAVHDVITEVGSGAVYVFDCLSELAEIWQADAMLGNFFMLTCPRLLEFQSLTYFGLYRNRHSSFGLKPIEDTCQFMLDVFRRGGATYIRPLKVQYRSAGVMNMIHVRSGDEFQPVRSSAEIADLLSSIAWRGLQASGPEDVWHRDFSRAHELVHRVPSSETDDPERCILFERLLSWLVSGDEQMRNLAHRYFTLEDLVTIHNRMIGIGQIGGKSVGMLLARVILRRHAPDLHDRMEPHDSFYLGSELYYTFLVRNRVWWIRQRQRDSATFLEEIQEARELIFQGSFPSYVMDRFRELLEYFGEAPYIVRSSSLLEDAYGNAFAGQYESVFCVNQGPLELRLAALVDAIRKVYASTLSENALRYRQRRGLLQQDEQMALLIMRVSGSAYGRFFYPHAAGVGLSFNPFVWNRDIDPHAGVIRMVFGLGTRAVDRADDDHTRLVALNAPSKRPESGMDEIQDASQRKMDCLDIVDNKLISGWFEDITGDNPELPLALFTELHPTNGRKLLTFNPIMEQTGIIGDFRRILHLLAETYETAVDIEFTVNVITGGDYRINLLQCRPLQIHLAGEPGSGPSLSAKDVLLNMVGPVIGASRRESIQRVIYIIPEKYARLNDQQRHGVARIIGRINQTLGKKQQPFIIFGPGRWGTRQPSLGIPARFSEIDHAQAVVEVVTMHERLVPDASLGTHYLNELIESGLLYVVLDPRDSRVMLDAPRILSRPNQLADLVSDPQGLEPVIQVTEFSGLYLSSDMQEQRVVLGFPEITR